MNGDGNGKTRWMDVCRYVVERNKKDMSIDSLQLTTHNSQLTMNEKGKGQGGFNYGDNLDT